MNAPLKAIHYFFHLTNPSSHYRLQKSNIRRKSIISFANPGSPDPGSSVPDGDKRKQELLAQIAMLQAQKVRLTDLLDDRSAHLSQFVEEANAEFDAIGENALKELDDAGSRILEKLERRMQEFEGSEEMSEKGSEIDENVLQEFEAQIDRDRNEGLFFKNLKQETPPRKTEVVEVARKLREAAKESAASRARRSVYLALIALMILAVGNALAGGEEVEWRKVGALSLILVGLVAQLIYEQSMSSARDDETNLKN